MLIKGKSPSLDSAEGPWVLLRVEPKALSQSHEASFSLPTSLALFLFLPCLQGYALINSPAYNCRHKLTVPRCHDPVDVMSPT